MPFEPAQINLGLLMEFHGALTKFDKIWVFQAAGGNCHLLYYSYSGSYEKDGKISCQLQRYMTTLPG